MQFIIVISMIFALFIALFAIQNATVITINFLWYKFNLSQAVVILGSALFGILIMLPFDIVKRVRFRIKINELNSKIKKLDEELSIAKETINKTKEDLDLKNQNNINIEQ
ncbi:lipopolysaccharide assembly LapA domain-containing protein [Lutispora sp.]|uniref:LapA family protein n=1 Tax=Lutispora sp. TaxID=2828727 RepID=UPI0035689176